MNLWVLIAINGWSIAYYYQHPGSFNSVLWLYWCQSVLIGIFNFMYLMSFKSTTVNSGGNVYFFGSKGCSAYFFLFHYQMFHLGYAFFIIISGSSVDKQFLIIGVCGFAVNMLIAFIQNKRKQITSAQNFTKLFFLPYLRIIPMHLMILLPVFLHLRASVVFLVLKAIADVAMYLVVSSPKPSASTNTA